MSNPNPLPDPAIAQAINEVTNAGQQPIEIVIGPHEKFVGNTPQELLEKMAAAKVESNRFADQLKAENAELRSKTAQLEQRIPKEPPTPSDAKATQYYEQWAKDPTKANMQSFADALGLPAEQLVPVLRNVIESATARTAADEFVNRYPGFEGNPSNVQMLRDRVQLRFGQNLGAATADNLELAYQSLVREGKIVPGQQAFSGVEGQPTPIPNLRGGSAPPNAELELRERAYSMPLEDLKKAVERAGQLTNRR